jgi:hypothetical protein
VRQIHKTLDMDTISLDGIDTTVAWRVETERPIMESILDWLHKDGVVAEREVEEEDVLEQSQQTHLEDVTIDTGSAPAPPPSRNSTERVVLGSSTSRGH